MRQYCDHCKAPIDTPPTWPGNQNKVHPWRRQHQKACKKASPEERGFYIRFHAWGRKNAGGFMTGKRHPEQRLTCAEAVQLYYNTLSTFSTESLPA